MKKFLLFLSLISLSFGMVSPVMAASNASATLRAKVVTEGDGIYKDEVTDGRYVYKGSNPNNFIKFNNELWRIMAVETDGSLKIIRANALDNGMVFDLDTVKNDFSKGDYCYMSGFGCNAWGKSDYFNNGYYPSNVSSSDFSFEGKISEDSTINKYLNGIYLSNLSNGAGNQIVSYKYGIGGVDYYNKYFSDYFSTQSNYLNASNKYSIYKDKYDQDPTGNSYDDRYGWRTNEYLMNAYKEKMDTYKETFDNLSERFNDEIEKSNKDIKNAEDKYSWNGKVAMASVSDIVGASNNSEKCGSWNLINSNYYDDDSIKDYVVDVKYKTESGEGKTTYTSHVNNSFNKCSESNYLIPSKKYKFTDFNYFLITPVYGSNETVYASSYQGVSPEYVYDSYSSRYFNTYSVRPVTHLNSSISITGGDGSENSPYTLSSMGGTSSSNSISSSIAQIVDVPATSMFTSIFIIVGAVALLIISGYLYLKVFKKKGIN